jgi:ABC-2 type transport system permease protein
VKAIAYELNTAAKPRRRTGIVAHEFLYDLRTYVRNRQGVFFSFALPIMFLVIFASVFGHGRVSVGGFSMSEAAYYVPGIMAMGLVSTSFNNLAASIVGNREVGIYKRRRATPVPAGALIAGRTLVAVAASLATTAVLAGIGYAYGASLPGKNVPVLVLDVVVFTFALCCLAFALATVVRGRDAVMPIVMAITLPLYFISGVFVPSTEIPHWLLRVAGFFPIRHMASALLAVYNPHAGGGAHWTDLAVVAGWGVFGLIIAVRRFSWLPRSR